ncbi:MAG: hypothetical protein V7542_12765, partial [Limnobacter sp.]
MRNANASSHRLLRNRPALRIRREALQSRQGGAASKPHVAHHARASRKPQAASRKPQAASRK